VRRTSLRSALPAQHGHTVLVTSTTLSIRGKCAGSAPRLVRRRDPQPRPGSGNILRAKRPAVSLLSRLPKSL